MSLLELVDVSKTFRTPHEVVRAVGGITLSVVAGETLGIIGESGSGKSTLGRLILRLNEPDSGSIVIEGQDVLALTRRQLRRQRRHWQMVFQEPFASLNPRLTVRQIVEEPLIVAKMGTRAERRACVTATLEEVGLSADFLDRRPANLSGGQQQRVGIARALVTKPSLVVLDEPTSSLDLTIRASILRMLASLRASRELTYVFISHDIETVRHFCSRVAVMHHGQFVEVGPTRDVLANPQHPYTKALISAALPVVPYSAVVAATHSSDGTAAAFETQGLSS